jgi:hypothetical protein
MQRSQRSVIGWVTKIYYLELLRASESTLSRWFRLYLQSVAPAPVSRRVDVRDAGKRPVVKIVAESLSQHDEKHVVSTTLSGIKVGRRLVHYPDCTYTNSFKLKVVNFTYSKTKHCSFVSYSIHYGCAFITPLFYYVNVTAPHCNKMNQELSRMNRS